MSTIVYVYIYVYISVVISKLRDGEKKPIKQYKIIRSIKYSKQQLYFIKSALYLCTRVSRQYISYRPSHPKLVVLYYVLVACSVLDHSGTRQTTRNPYGMRVYRGYGLTLRVNFTPTYRCLQEDHGFTVLILQTVEQLKLTSTSIYCIVL